MSTIRDAKFVDGWMNMKPRVPVPIIDHVKQKFLDVPYGEHALQKLDIYLPETNNLKHPVMVIVHGGGFSACDKRDWHLYPGFYGLREGFAVVSVNYRLAPAFKFPAQPHDLKAALRFLKKNADKYHLDPENVFLWGTSAGGNLVSLVGNTLKTN